MQERSLEVKRHASDFRGASGRCRGKIVPSSRLLDGKKDAFLVRGVVVDCASSSNLGRIG